ncbi:hypothetical protein B0A55_02054 [Friedmanniomyces simplex]|uniref:Uncharacterized protein n=1 Tax=Friedmanniomyces simplex TaxID=329884 RepID=A0A4U0XY37_9PEZI|nr:hypothetical protein B0A55_02054 [Friedmanniomyces simplex]
MAAAAPASAVEPSPTLIRPSPSAAEPAAETGMYATPAPIYDQLRASASAGPSSEARPVSPKPPSTAKPDTPAYTTHFLDYITLKVTAEGHSQAIMMGLGDRGSLDTLLRKLTTTRSLRRILTDVPVISCITLQIPNDASAPVTDVEPGDVTPCEELLQEVRGRFAECGGRKMALEATVELSAGA